MGVPRNEARRMSCRGGFPCWFRVVPERYYTDDGTARISPDTVDGMPTPLMA